MYVTLIYPPNEITSITCDSFRKGALGDQMLFQSTRNDHNRSGLSLVLWPLPLSGGMGGAWVRG